MVGLCLLLSILGQAIWLPSINLQHPGHLLLKATMNFRSILSVDVVDPDLLF